jgi:eukaryotic-like serine/threonine-protein kinase
MDDPLYTDAFKRHALSLIEYAGLTVDEVASKTDIPTETLLHWNATINLLENISSKEKQTLVRLDSIHSKQTLEAGETLIAAWMDFDDSAFDTTPPDLNINDWTPPSYDHPTPLLSRGSILGEGGMGRVMIGVQASTGREVAVKEVRAEKASAFIVRRLLQEAWITGLLEHPNIIPVYTIEPNEDNQPMILMKRISGETWLSYIQSPDSIPNTENDLERLQWHLNIFDEVCSAVHYAHDKGIIHRDIKPENVMLGSYDEVYLLDWGIALAIDDRYQSWIPTTEQSRGVAGTPAYIAPEMISEGVLSIQSDIYLLGAILYEVAEGTPPHESVSIEHLAEHCSAFEPTFVQTPIRLQTIIRKAMHIDATKRYDDVTELQQELFLFLKSLDVQKIIDGMHIELEGFEEHIQSDTPSRNALYERFIAVRFGLRQIHKDFITNADFNRYENMLRDLCDWELTENRPNSAELLLNEFRTFPADLQEQIDVQKETRRSDTERLHRIDIEQSDTIGIRTRAFVLVLTIVGWAIFPIWFIVTQTDYNYGHLFMQTTGILSWMLLIGVSAKDTLSSTEVNRRTFGLLLCEPLFHTITDLCAWTMDWPAQEAWLLRFVVWSTMLLSYGVLMELRFLPIAFIYSLITIGLFSHPELSNWVAVGLNVFLLLSIGFVWRKEMREAVDARKV